MQREMAMENWWNDTERKNPQYAENKHVSMSISPPQISH
jgi:hypothetical protein